MINIKLELLKSLLEGGGGGVFTLPFQQQSQCLVDLLMAGVDSEVG